MVSQYMGAAGQRYVYDPAAGAYYDTWLGQHVMTVPSNQQTDTTFDASPSSGTVEAYPEFGPAPIPDEGWATGESTMMAAPATVEAIPMGAIDSGQVAARQHSGDPLSQGLVPPGYRDNQLSDTMYLGDLTTEQMPVPAPLYPGSGWTDPGASPGGVMAPGSAGDGGGYGGYGTGGGYSGGYRYGDRSSGGSRGSSYGSGYSSGGYRAPFPIGNSSANADRYGATARSTSGDYASANRYGANADSGMSSSGASQGTTMVSTQQSARGAPSSSGVSSSGFSNIPSHPSSGGSGLTPGGDFNDGSSSSRPMWGPRTDVHSNEGGQWVNPPWERPMNKAIRDLGWNLRMGALDRMTQAAQPGPGGMGGMMGGAPAMGGGMMAGGMGLGGGAVPSNLRNMRGWAGQQNFAPAMLQDIYYNPQWLYPHILPGLSTGSNAFNQINDLLTPNLQSLWSASVGSRRRAARPALGATGGGLAGGLAGGAPTGLGMGPVGPDHYANWVNRVVKNYTRPGGQLFNANTLIRGLTNPARGSTQWMANQGQTFGEQSYNLQNQIGSVAATTMNPMAASATMSYLDSLINAAGSRNLKRGPMKQINPGRHVGRHLFR